jgi:hypothetical protein
MFTKQICSLFGMVGLVAASVTVGPDVKDTVKSAIDKTVTAVGFSDDAPADPPVDETKPQEVLRPSGVYVGSYAGPGAVAIAGPVGAVAASGAGAYAGAGVGARAYAGGGGISVGTGTGTFVTSTANSHGGNFSGMVSTMNSSGQVTTYTYGSPEPRILKTRKLEPVTVAPKTVAPVPTAKGTPITGGTLVTPRMTFSRPVDEGSLHYTDQMVSDSQGGYWREFGYSYTSQGKPYTELRRIHVSGR